MRVFTSAVCLSHEAPPGYPERPERLQAVLEALRLGGYPISEVVPSDAHRSAIEAIHDPAYVARFERAAAREDGFFDSSDNPLCRATWDAARGAVAAAVAAADEVVREGGMAFAAVRPPGHHAERDLAMGFCFFNNVAVAAERMIRLHGCHRVAIFDFDVHHGNGTQHLFEDRADVFYASVHQYPFYPGTGAAAETGGPRGQGATLNVPLPAGSDDAAYEEAIRHRILPALKHFRPDALLLSAGFDAWQGDPLGGMNVSRDGFRAWGEWLREFSLEVCGGRVVAVLEGGYDLQALPALVGAHLAGLAGSD